MAPMAAIASGARHRQNFTAETDLYCGDRETGISQPNNQRQHRTLPIQKDVLQHIQKDVLPYTLC